MRSKIRNSIPLRTLNKGIMNMKKKLRTYMVILPVSAIAIMVALPEKADAQLAILEVIKAGVKRVIKAVDLKIQRTQNETIWLQNAQKVLENQLSKLKLGEIADWTEKQRQLYGKYYQELWQIKSALSYYHRIRELMAKQTAIVEEYQRAWNLFKQDQHFTRDELDYMGKVYQGILEESVKNVDQILMVVNSFKMQMDDAKRLEIIYQAADKIDVNYNDLKQFNDEQSRLSIQRGQSEEEVKRLKEVYGILD